MIDWYIECNIVTWSGTKCNAMFWDSIPVPWLIPTPNIIPFCTTRFVAPNVIIIIIIIIKRSYPGNSAKCDSRYFFLSFLSVYALYLKHLQIGNDRIPPELLLTVWVIHGNKVAGLLAIQRQEELSVNNFQSWPGSNWYKVVLYIPQNLWTGATSLNCSMSYTGISLGCFIHLQRCRQRIQWALTLSLSLYIYIYIYIYYNNL